MGCEGGSIPKRTDVVKVKGKAEKIDESEVLKTLWTCCFLSKKPLERPVVACKLGRLYNKDSIVMYLLNSRQDQELSDPVLKAEMNHIKSMKNVTTCKLINSKQPDSPYFACPISDREMNGRSKFYFTKTCGCILSEQALRQFPSTKNCLVCDRKDFEGERDLVVLYPKIEEIERIRRDISKIEETDKVKNKRRLSLDTDVNFLKDKDINPPQSSNDSFVSKSKTPANLLKEVKASGEISSLKKTKVTNTLYINK